MLQESEDVVAGSKPPQEELSSCTSCMLQEGEGTVVDAKPQEELTSPNSDILQEGEGAVAGSKPPQEELSSCTSGMLQEGEGTVVDAKPPQKELRSLNSDILQEDEGGVAGSKPPQEELSSCTSCMLQEGEGTVVDAKPPQKELTSSSSCIHQESAAVVADLKPPEEELTSNSFNGTIEKVAVDLQLKRELIHNQQDENNEKVDPVSSQAEDNPDQSAAVLDLKEIKVEKPVITSVFGPITADELNAVLQLTGKDIGTKISVPNCSKEQRLTENWPNHFSETGNYRTEQPNNCQELNSVCMEAGKEKEISSVDSNLLCFQDDEELIDNSQEQAIKEIHSNLKEVQESVENMDKLVETENIDKPGDAKIVDKLTEVENMDISIEAEDMDTLSETENVSKLNETENIDFPQFRKKKHKSNQQAQGFKEQRSGFKWPQLETKAAENSGDQETAALIAQIDLYNELYMNDVEYLLNIDYYDPEFSFEEVCKTPNSSANNQEAEPNSNYFPRVNKNPESKTVQLTPKRELTEPEKIRMLKYLKTQIVRNKLIPNRLAPGLWRFFEQFSGVQRQILLKVIQEQFKELQSVRAKKGSKNNFFNVPIEDYVKLLVEQWKSVLEGNIVGIIADPSATGNFHKINPRKSNVKYIGKHNFVENVEEIVDQRKINTKRFPQWIWDALQQLISSDRNTFINYLKIPDRIPFSFKFPPKPPAENQKGKSKAQLFHSFDKITLKKQSKEKYAANAAGKYTAKVAPVSKASRDLFSSFTGGRYFEMSAPVMSAKEMTPRSYTDPFKASALETVGVHQNSNFTEPSFIPFNDGLQTPSSKEGTFGAPSRQFSPFANKRTEAEGTSYLHNRRSYDSRKSHNKGYSDGIVDFQDRRSSYDSRKSHNKGYSDGTVDFQDRHSSYDSRKSHNEEYSEGTVDFQNRRSSYDSRKSHNEGYSDGTADFQDRHSSYNSRKSHSEGYSDGTVDFQDRRSSYDSRKSHSRGYSDGDFQDSRSSCDRAKPYNMGRAADFQTLRDEDTRKIIKKPYGYRHPEDIQRQPNPRQAVGVRQDIDDARTSKNRYRDNYKRKLDERDLDGQCGNFNIQDSYSQGTSRGPANVYGSKAASHNSDQSKRYKTDPNDQSSKGNDSKQVVIADEGNPQGVMSEEQAALLSMKLLQSLDCLSPAETHIPRFYGSGLTQGVFKITCADQQSVDWLELTVARLSALWQGAKLYVVPFSEYPPQWVMASVYIPGLADDPSVALKRLERQNPGLNTGVWRVIRLSGRARGQVLFLEIDKPSLEVLKGMNFKAFLGLSCITFQVSDNSSKKAKGKEY